MLLQTAAIELQRKNMNVRVVALQPGMVRSKLSNPFVDKHSNLLEPQDSVFSILEAMKHLTLRSGANFIDFKGNEIPW